MHPAFVKKFDFRGIYNQDITDSDAYYLGLALEAVLDIKTVLIGWDTRPSSKNLAMHMIQAFQYHGIAIYYIEKSPIDFITSSGYLFDFDASIMVTGSHNPQNWTGLLIHTKGGESLQGALVDKIVNEYTEAKKQPFEKKELLLSNFEDFSKIASMNFAGKLYDLLPLRSIKPYNVIVDIGDGSGSKALDMVELLLPQVKITRINDRKLYDENSPHVADPSDPQNMHQLSEAVQKQGADVGFAFDSDADRVLAVDEKGQYVNGSLLGSAMSEVFLAEKLAEKSFGYAVDCGVALPNALVTLNKTYNNSLTINPIPVGRSIMRGMIRKRELDFAVENVGHFYCKDFFMTDSGAFSLVVVLYWMSMNGALSTLQEKYPDGYREQQFHPVSAENTLEALEKEINTNFAHMEKRKIDVDGIRYEFYENDMIKTWYAVRKSGYEAIEKYYFGSTDEKDFATLKKNINSSTK